MFANQGRREDIEQIFPGTQVIIPDYSFTCYGNVTQWGAWVDRGGGNEEYTLDFQVWRRSEEGQGTTGCYELVDNNLFLAVNPDGGEIIVPVAVEDQIQVRPGDVVGFSVVSSSRQDNGMDRQDNGVELQDDDGPPGGDVAVTAWHGPLPMSASAAASCRIQVGNVVGYELRSSTSAAPIITVVVGKRTNLRSAIYTELYYPNITLIYCLSGHTPNLCCGYAITYTTSQWDSRSCSFWKCSAYCDCPAYFDHPIYWDCPTSTANPNSTDAVIYAA